MKHMVNIYEAKTHLSRLVDEAAQGEDILIARAGKPVAKLSRIEPKAKKRKLGLLKGQIKIPEDFNAPLPDEIQAAFEGMVSPPPQPSPASGTSVPRRGGGGKR